MASTSNSAQAFRKRAQAAEQNVTIAKTREDALEAAINAAEGYMRALKLTDNDAERQDLDSKCKQWLNTAEKIKLDPDWKQSIAATAAAKDPFLTKPTSRRELTTREKIILLEGSKINGFVFQPWKDDPNSKEFHLPLDGALFEDAPRLALSAEQKEIFGGWKRPKDALGALSAAAGEDGPLEPTMTRGVTVDLVQDAGSDCSIVASLCAGAARAERGHAKLLSTIIYPYDHKSMRPAVSPSGKYILRLTFNGCERKVIIDDLLPTSTTSQTLHVVDRANPGLLWPALIEKAYLKVRGGYDFPGSNSGTDLATLTGWVPEQVFLHDEDILPRELWKRIFNSFSHGDVLITIGTGALSEREQRQLGLAGEHDYAVIDMREKDGFCELLIKNPWSDGDVWRGKRRGGRENLAEHDSTIAAEQQPVLTPGTFWMDLGSVFQHFENIYLNWNPGLFTYREDDHFTWDLSQASSIGGYFGSNPQFTIIAGATGPVWFLLSKHFKSGDGGQPKASQEDRGYISLYLFGNGGKQVLVSEGAIHRGPFVDSPNTLMRVELLKSTPYTIAVAAQSLPADKYNFTLSAFSRSKMVMSPVVGKYEQTITKSAAWTRSTAGGNSDSPGHVLNPQFSLSVPAKASMAIVLTPESKEIAVHAKVIFVSTASNASPQRIYSVRVRDILAQSGDYKRGCAVIETSLDAGLYTVLCSTFEPAQLSRFTISASSTRADLQLRPLPPEGSGRLTSISAPALFPSGDDRLLAPVQVSRLTRAYFIARYVPASRPVTGSKARRAALKVSLEVGQGPYKEVVATSATSEKEFDDHAFGVRIADRDLRPEWSLNGGLWLVLERVGSAIGDGSNKAGSDIAHEAIEVEAFGEGKVEIGTWGTGSG